jgi:hypothetical protein
MVSNSYLNKTKAYLAFFILISKKAYKKRKIEGKREEKKK